MNWARIKHTLSWLLLVIVVAWGCTSNPLDDSKVTGSPNQISGQVILDNEASPESVYVWLKKRDLGTYADDKGDFLITLPPPLTQSTNSGIEFDTLYFYLANYLLESSEIMLVDGELAYDHSDLDKNGRIRQSPIVMKRFLKISTSVEPDIIRHDAPAGEDTVFVTAQLEAEASCGLADIAAMGARDRNVADGPLGAALIRKVGAAQANIIRGTFFESNGHFVVPICQTPVFRDLYFVLSSGDLDLVPGTYEIFPFILTNPQNVPLRLLERIGYGVNELGENYLKKPMRWNAGKLVVE